MSGAVAAFSPIVTQGGQFIGTPFVRAVDANVAGHDTGQAPIPLTI